MLQLLQNLWECGNMNLKEVREKKNMTQQELANKSGLHQVTIARYENGTRSATEDAIHKLKEALDCTYDELLKKES